MPTCRKGVVDRHRTFARAVRATLVARGSIRGCLKADRDVVQARWRRRRKVVGADMAGASVTQVEEAAVMKVLGLMSKL